MVRPTEHADSRTAEAGVVEVAERVKLRVEADAAAADVREHCASGALVRPTDAAMPAHRLEEVKARSMAGLRGASKRRLDRKRATRAQVSQPALALASAR